MNPADLAAQLSDATRLVWLEAPGSVTLEFPDLPALVAVVAQANQQRTANGKANPRPVSLVTT
jgi:cystathionine beta-lyase